MWGGGGSFNKFGCHGVMVGEGELVVGGGGGGGKNVL